MPLPKFNETGDLPVGVHKATLSEVIATFGTSTVRRRQIAQRLARIYHIAVGTGNLAQFIVFGSFVTNKPEPNDVDVFLLMDDTFDVTRVTGEAHILFEHASAQNYFGASVFWVRRMAALGGDEVIEDWQLKRDGTRRGIIEIIGD
ncbi:hypothetical protein H8E77_07560 [bacterium]|nr:hypothetical protein [bacterium]